MEQQPKPESLSYTENGTKFTREGSEKGLKRFELKSLIHGRTTVSDTREWDEVMHPQIDKLKPGETTVLKSDAYEYVKVTKNIDETYDAEFGEYDEGYGDE